MPLRQLRSKLTMPVSERDHAQGPPDAPVTLVEYGDYECPYCGKAYPIIKRLQKAMGERLRFVFRNFPLNTIHAHASVAAQAAEAAGAQGKFWEMHDILYEHQDTLADHDLHAFALKIGLEIYKFDADLSSERFAKRVREDFQSGVRSGVNGTPTFFINDLRYDGEKDYDALLAALDDAASDAALQD
ncbi:MAG: thioredoxin domain-containing protein [Tepidisphaeraceae bacterium]